MARNRVLETYRASGRNLAPQLMKIEIGGVHLKKNSTLKIFELLATLLTKTE